MYLSRIRLNPTRLRTRQLLGSPQITHALVEGSRPAGAGHHPGRSLWRLDRDGPDIELYVTSPWRPDFTGLVEQAGWPTAATWDTREYGAFLRTLSNGQRWEFRVTVNPTRVIAQGEGRRGKVSPHRTAEHQTQWFLERAEGWGFAVGLNSLPEPASELLLIDRTLVAFRRRSGEEAERTVGRVSLTHATFRGALTIADADRFRESITTGLGRAKGYGCGLMTLAPPR